MNWPILGHQKISAYLQKSLKNGIIYPVYLFIGPKSVGKRTVAENFIQTLHCYAHDQNKHVCSIYPCSECVHCQQLAKNFHPDHLTTSVLPEKKQISIEQIRHLQSKLLAKPFLSHYKTALIQDIDTLSAESANALLKNLEEPPAKTVIVLTAANKENILPTILSRCQLIHFSPVSFDEIHNYLLSKNINQDQAREITLLSQGRPGLVINQIKTANLNDQPSTKKEFLQVFKSHKIPERLNYIESQTKDKSFKPVILDEWTSVLRDLLVSKLALDNLVVNISLKKELQTALAESSLKRLIRALKQVQAAQVILRGNTSPKLVLENLIINI